MIYATNYDLKIPGQDYKGLYEAIKGCGTWGTIWDRPGGRYQAQC